MSRTDNVTDIEIRPLERGDAQRLQVLFDALGEQSRQWFHPHRFDGETARALADGVPNDKERRYLMIKREGGLEQVVGYGFLLHLSADMPELGIAIADHAHGHGYGERMMKHLIESGRQLGKRGIQLEVYDDNLAARRLYRRCGFTTRRIAHHMDVVFGEENTCV